MALSSQMDDNNRQSLFNARVDNVKSLFQILKAIHFKDHAVFYLTEDGLKVTVEDLKCVQVSAFIQSEVFQEYRLNNKNKEDLVAFKIKLSVLLECLNIFGNSPTNSGSVTALIMSYQGYGFPLELILEEDGVITNCTIRTQTAEEALDFHFDDQNDLSKVILVSDGFKEVMHDLDSSSDVLELSLSPDPAMLRLSTTGECGESQTDIPSDCDIVDSFQCAQVLSFSYKFCHVKPCIRPLSCSTKVSLKLDERGLLCFQYMIPMEDSQICFVEYFCTPVVQVDDEDIIMD